MSPFRKVLSLGLIWLLTVQASRSVQAEGLGQMAPPPAAAGNPQPVQPSAPPPLEELVKGSSIEIAAWAEQFAFSQNAIKARIEALKQEGETREKAFKTAAKSAEKQIEQKEQELAKLLTSSEETQRSRKKILCKIAKVRKDITAGTFEFLQSEIADDVTLSKLDLAATWRSVSRQLDQKIANGTITDRPHGDAINIGHRTTRNPFKGQADDQAWGKKEIDDARTNKLFPQQIKDPVVTEYVNRLANNLARNSDLEVPLNTYVVQ